MKSAEVACYFALGTCTCRLDPKQDDSISGMALAAMERGAYVNLNWAASEIKSAWARITDDLAMIVLAVDSGEGRFAVTNKRCFEGNFGPHTGVLALKFDERSCSIDATFKIGRDGDVLSSFGTTSIHVATNTQVADSVAKLLEFEGLGKYAPEKTDTGHRAAQTFRPFLWVWGPTESKAAWDLGFACIEKLAAALYGAKKDELFAICIADHAASGRLAFTENFPKGKWLSCWVHVLRRVLSKKSDMPAEWSAEKKKEEAKWFQDELRKLFLCPSEAIMHQRWEYTKQECVIRDIGGLADVSSLNVT